ncbi:MAG: ABC transporter permease [Anaerolineae bacterium]|jgi:peptide/nickel transport system permease protein|nr:ABC transporter permease [Anaerolineae bacterium]
METTINQPLVQGQEPESLKLEVASQAQLIWWKFRKHKLAIVSSVILIIFYTLALFCEFFAPWSSVTFKSAYAFMPPQVLRLFHDGQFSLHVNNYTYEREPLTMRRIWSLDEESIIPVGFFVKGDAYKLWGLIPSDIHFIGSKDPTQPFFLMGTDRIGRDIMSRLIYSARISLTVGLVGIALSFFLGITLGGISGLIGGVLDNLIQRAIEILISIPQLPFWLALAAMVPVTWTALQTYFMISIILSLLSWTGLARVVRSKFLSLREEDFVMAARLDGCKNFRLITVHMLPSFMSHIIASITLSIPGMIIGETALSFLGLGLRPPIVSWGVMLQDTQKIVAVAEFPWLLYPALAVFIVVLAFNFLGDGLRDAADPY